MQKHTEEVWQISVGGVAWDRNTVSVLRLCTDLQAHSSHVDL